MSVCSLFPYLYEETPHPFSISLMNIRGTFSTLKSITDPFDPSSSMNMEMYNAAFLENKRDEFILHLSYTL